MGLCIKTGDICWWNGPYEPGIWNDEMIFKDALVSMLEYGKRCETDGGYRGSAPEFVKCPKGVWGESGKWAVQQRVRSRQETVNKRLKNWGILVTPYLIVTILSCTKQCLLQLLFFSSCPLNTTRCFWWNIMTRLTVTPVNTFLDLAKY